MQLHKELEELKETLEEDAGQAEYVASLSGTLYNCET